MESSFKAAMLAQPRLLKLVPVFAVEGILAWDDVKGLTDDEMRDDLSMNLGARRAFRKMITEHQVCFVGFMCSSLLLYPLDLLFLTSFPPGSPSWPPQEMLTNCS